MKGKFCEYDENHFCQNKSCAGCAIYKAMTTCRMIELCNGCESCLYGESVCIVSRTGEPVDWVCEAPHGMWARCKNRMVSRRYVGRAMGKIP